MQKQKGHATKYMLALIYRPIKKSYQQIGRTDGPCYCSLFHDPTVVFLALVV